MYETCYLLHKNGYIDEFLRPHDDNIKNAINEFHGIKLQSKSNPTIASSQDDHSSSFQGKKDRN